MLGWLGNNAVALVALLGSGAALVYSRRATRASEESAKGSLRSAEVAERQEHRQIQEAERNAVRWQLEPEATAMAESYGIRLTNAGLREAHDVHLDLPENAQIVGGGEPRWGSIDPGGAVSLEVAMFSGVQAATLRVNWSVQPGGEIQTAVLRWPL